MSTCDGAKYGPAKSGNQENYAIAGIAMLRLTNTDNYDDIALRITGLAEGRIEEVDDSRHAAWRPGSPDFAQRQRYHNAYRESINSLVYNV